jgi:hypothetical protein
MGSITVIVLPGLWALKATVSVGVGRGGDSMTGQRVVETAMVSVMTVT